MSHPGPKFACALSVLVSIALALLAAAPSDAPPSAVSDPPGLLKTAMVQSAPPAPPVATPALTAHAGQMPVPQAERHEGTPPIAAVALPPVGNDGTIAYEVKKGESLPGIVHRFLPQSSLMTSREFEAAVRLANPELKGVFPKPGSTLTLPYMEPQPIAEAPRPYRKETEIRAVYLTGTMAGSEHGLEIIRRWHEAGGNAVVFDIKDSDGSVNIPFNHPLAPSNYHPIPNLAKFVRYVHSLNMHAIARIAVFRDELMVRRHPELAVQSRKSGQPWRENGKLVWTDPSRPEVQDYVIALAEHVAESGADEIQFDYVRFPAEGDQADAKFLFQTKPISATADDPAEATRADVIAGFLQRAYGRIHQHGVLLSLDVFGVMAWQRPVDLNHTGQDIVRMAHYCDVLSPMIYPSHFFGMDGYALPGDAPEHFISESMDRFRTITKGENVVLRPWLQAFGWRTKTYSPQYIMTQVSTARDRGGIGFLFWNARNDYSKPFEAMPEMNAHPDKYYGAVTPAGRPAQAQKAVKATTTPTTRVAKSGGARPTTSAQ
jgi:hypothetical protein